nr:uncharacterized protein LOC129137827 [Pan troglodytes]
MTRCLRPLKETPLSESPALDGPGVTLRAAGLSGLLPGSHFHGVPSPGCPSTWTVIIVTAGVMSPVANPSSGDTSTTRKVLPRGTRPSSLLHGRPHQLPQQLSALSSAFSELTWALWNQRPSTSHCSHLQMFTSREDPLSTCHSPLFRIIAALPTSLINVGLQPYRSVIHKQALSQVGATATSLFCTDGNVPSAL